MTPHKQLFSHRPAEGQYGDCHRTCIACLLDVLPAEVPHPYLNGSVSAEEANEVLDFWLYERFGLRQVHMVYGGKAVLGEMLKVISGLNPGLHFIVSGTSRTGCNHFVIACDGEIIHDPSTSDSGIVGPCDDGLWWITFLAKATT